MLQRLVQKITIQNFIFSAKKNTIFLEIKEILLVNLVFVNLK